ncbi:excalibur calcium-binding domain-containing protein [Cellulomonas sp. NPDC055163]
MPRRAAAGRVDPAACFHPPAPSADPAPAAPAPAPAAPAPAAPAPAAPAPAAPAPAEPEPDPASATDPRFGSCKEAIGAGYGPYYAGVNPEYGWYRDGDNDGKNCES